MRIVQIRKLKEGMFGDPKTGWSAYPFISGTGGKGADIRGVHVVAIYPGQLRGNHYHSKGNELLFIFSGSGIFYWEEDGKLREHPTDAHTPTVITIPPGVRHAFRNTGEAAVYLLAVRDGEFDMKEPDVVKSELVRP